MDQTNDYDLASHVDFHVFQFREKYFIYDINKMNVYSITSDIYEKIYNDPIYFNKIKAQLEKGKVFNLNNRDSIKKKTQALRSISLNVAQICNLSCVYCYGIDGEYGTKGKMLRNTAFNSVDFLIKESKNTKHLSIIFFGGEPLLNFPLIKEVVNYSRAKGKEVNKTFNYSMTTNGTRFTDEVIEYLNENKFSVTVSFDGAKEIQDKNRPMKGGKGSYETIYPQIVKFLKSRNGRANGRATVTNHSFNSEEIKLSLKKMGFKSVGVAVATVSEHALKTREIERVNDTQRNHLHQQDEIEADLILSNIKQKKSLDGLRDSKILGNIFQLKSKKKSQFACGVGRSFLGISIKGDLYPCHRFVGQEKFNLGNISNYDTEKRNDYSISYTEKHPICKNCWAKFQCGGGGCLHDNYVNNGDVNNLNTKHCFQLKAQLKHAIYIYSMLTEIDKEWLFSNVKKSLIPDSESII